MVPFLRSLAEALLKEHGNALREVAVVLPSQRAGLYLSRHLAELNGGALWSPELFTFPTFMERLAGWRTADQVGTLITLHGVLRALKGGAAEPLAEFLQWAPATLRDMSEVDAHLVDRDRFYRDLRTLDEVEAWSLRLGDPSPGQQRLLSYWALKRDLHAGLDAALAGRGSGTAGAIERRAFEVLRNTPSLEWKRVWIAGANALTKAQSAVVNELRDRGLARFAWDADRYYLDDDVQEAGRHLRDHIAQWGGGTITASNDLIDRERRIVEIGVPNAVAQVHAAAGLIAGLDSEERSRTAVLLAEESLLMPLLRALLQDVGPVNVTMGMPAAALPVAGLFDTFFQLHASRRIDPGFPVDALGTFLLHPFLRPASDPWASDLIVALRDRHHTFIDHASLAERMAEWPGPLREQVLELLEPIGVANGRVHARLRTLIALALEAVDGDRFAREQLHRAALVQERMATLLSVHEGPLDARGYALLQQRVMRSERIGFFGEPLGGLQVMGMLETRAVDHDRLIVLPAMEGALPPSEGDRSFIPFDVRRAFKLPMPHDAEAVAAYTLHRAIQRAMEVVLIHHAGDEAAEPSRYIGQLRAGLDARSRTTWATRTLDVAHLPREAPATGLNRTPAVLDRVRQRLLRGLSPTLLTDHLNCPLDCWYRHVLGLRASEAAGEELGADRIGSAVHSVLHQIYHPFLGRPINASLLLLPTDEIADRLRAQLLRAWPSLAINEGQPMLQIQMAAEALRVYLEKDAERVEKGSPVTLVALEQAVRSELAVDLPGDPLTVPIVGTIDRIELRDGRIHILDYKTGDTKGQILKLDELEVPSLTRERRHAIQLMIYGWLWHRSNPGLPSVDARLVALRSPSIFEHSPLRSGDGGAIMPSHLEVIADLIRSLVMSMLDPNQPLAHNEASEHCHFCAT